MAAVFVLPDAGAFESIMDAAREVTGSMVLDPKSWEDVAEPLAVSLPRFKVEVKQLGLKEVSSKSLQGWEQSPTRHPASWVRSCACV